MRKTEERDLFFLRDYQPRPKYLTPYSVGIDTQSHTTRNFGSHVQKKTASTLYLYET